MSNFRKYFTDDGWLKYKKACAAYEIELSKLERKFFYGEKNKDE